METGSKSQHTINPPQYPSERSHTLTPHWYTHQDGHVDECGKAHGKGCQEQALVWMPKHDWKDLGIKNVPQARHRGEEEEEDQVEDEKDDGNYLEPISIVRQLVEQH